MYKNRKNQSSLLRREPAANAFGIDANYSKAQKCLSTGYYQKAAEIYSEIIEHRPRDFRAHYFRGVSYSKMNDNDNAIIDFTSAIALGKGFGKAHIYRGIIHCLNGSYLESMADFKRARLLDRDSNALENIFALLLEEKIDGSNAKLQSRAITEALLSNTEDIRMPELAY